MIYGKKLLYTIVIVLVTTSLILIQIREVINQENISQVKKKSLLEMTKAKEARQKSQYQKTVLGVKTKKLSHPNSSIKVITEDVKKSRTEKFKRRFQFPEKEMRRKNSSLYQEFFQQTGLNNKDTIIDIITSQQRSFYDTEDKLLPQSLADLIPNNEDALKEELGSDYDHFKQYQKTVYIRKNISIFSEKFKNRTESILQSTEKETLINSLYKIDRADQIEANKGFNELLSNPVYEDYKGFIWQFKDINDLKYLH